jgi:hypothetical protein
MALAVPQEILFLIVSNFEPKQRDAYEVEIWDYVADRKTLASLCLVSKRFYATAKPMLYRHVRLCDGDIRQFTRTIVADLETRELVVGLSLEFELPGTWEGTLTEASAFGQNQWDYDECLGEVLSLLAIAIAATGEGQGSVEAAGVGGSQIVVPGKSRFDDTAEEELAAVLLFVLPKLRYLRVKFDEMAPVGNPDVAGIWVCEMLLQTLRVACHVRSQHPTLSRDDFQALIPAGLFHLEELVMSNPFAEPGTIKGNFPAIGFNHLESMHPLWALPNLKSLTLERVAWDEETPLPRLVTPSVERLRLLNTAVSPSRLPRLLQGFPSLRSFTYELADPYSLTHESSRRITREMLLPEAIQRIVRVGCPRLEEFNLAAIIFSEDQDNGGETYEELLSNPEL